MPRAIPWIIAAVCFVAFGASFSELNRVQARLLELSRHEKHDHERIRQFMIRSQLRQAGEGSVVFIGDSITEGALLPPQICGHRTVNAGIGSEDTLSYALTLNQIGDFTASVAVVEIGTNDAYRGAGGDFAESYRKLVAALMLHSRILILAGIPPIERGPLSEHFDAERADQINAEIAAIAKETRHQFVDLRAVMASEGPPLTVDGVHPSAAGYLPWLREIDGKVASSLGC